MSESSVRYEVADGIAILTMIDEAHRNALSADLRAGLWRGFESMRDDPTVKVGILTGGGNSAVCAGGDLKEMAQEGIGVPGRDFVSILNRNIWVEKPVIAAVNGAAYGGGFMLAMMCDLAVAATEARFAMPEARWSRGAPWSVPLSRMIGERHWMELALTGDAITAQRAYEIGLVNRVVPRAALMEETFKLATRICANAPLTIRASQQMIYYAREMGRTAAWDVADELFKPVYQSEDAQEGPRAFREGRKPRWKNR
jgi:enoyl-CoA hydratase/carnithine racemase